MKVTLIIIILILVFSNSSQYFQNAKVQLAYHYKTKLPNVYRVVKVRGHELQVSEKEVLKMCV
jgi:hypothetical protein